jgi:chromosome segregation ATPase
MIKNYLLALSLSAFLFSCNQSNEENLQLQAQIDSLQSELLQSQRVAYTLQEVAGLMDSIDAIRNNVAINLENGPDDNYVARMQDLQEYVEASEAKLAELETALQTSKSVSQTYAATIKKLKQEIGTKNEEIAMLQQKVEGLQADNFQLVSTVETQNETIAMKTAEIMSQSQELAEAEARIQEMIIRQQISEADAYFARGEAVEEVANRTQLARKKKQASYKEALQLFEKSYALGRTDAKAKIDLLKEKIR